LELKLFGNAIEILKNNPESRTVKRIQCQKRFRWQMEGIKI